jgi:hypothetical protein
MGHYSGARKAASRSDHRGYFTLQVKVFRLPTQNPPRLVTAEPLIDCMASRPLAEPRDDLFSADDLQIGRARAKESCTCPETANDLPYR